jgi:DNA-binding XRE family transcriptional regulator
MNIHQTNIKKRRKAAMLTQQQAAEICSVDRRTWQYWEATGKINPNAWEIFKLKTGVQNDQITED